MIPNESESSPQEVWGGREPIPADAPRLTDAEIDAIMDEQWGDGLQPNQYQAHRAASRAIERAVLEKLGASGVPRAGGVPGTLKEDGNAR